MSEIGCYFDIQDRLRNHALKGRSMELHNIGIALSGGGIRATIFHLGLFSWLAENKLLEEVKRVSSVSGASLCVGLIYSHNNLKWPTSEEFLSTVLPSVQKVILTNDIQSSSIIRLICSPYYWNKKVNIIAKQLERQWGVYGNLSELSGDAIWYTNCTTYETGKRFRFCKENMGDYKIGYVKRPNIALSHVMAASAGFPVLIGPYYMDINDYQWVPSKYPSPGHSTQNKAIHLWDGGVYDNLGLESIFKPDNAGTLRHGLDYMIVSNASASIGPYRRQTGFTYSNLKRLLDISMDQVTSLRSRMVMDFIKRTKQGMYLKIGASAEKITSDSRCSDDLKKYLLQECLPISEAERAMNYKTTLQKPRKSDYQLLLRHGYEVANCTYRCYQK